MWTRNNDVPDRNMLKHFIYSSSSKPATSLLCSPYYRYSSELSSSFCILSFLVIAISIDQTFYSATHYLAAVWLDSRHDLNMKFNHSSCNWLIFFSSSSFLSKVTSNYFTFFLWSSCTRSQYSLSCKVKSCWLWNSFSILMTSSNWLLT